MLSLTNPLEVDDWFLIIYSNLRGGEENNRTRKQNCNRSKVKTRN